MKKKLWIVLILLILIAITLLFKLVINNDEFIIPKFDNSSSDKTDTQETKNQEPSFPLESNNQEDIQIDNSNDNNHSSDFSDDIKLPEVDLD